VTVFSLKIDYDRRNIQRFFGRRVDKLFMVYYVKREYLPDMKVTRVARTRHGYHVYARYKDPGVYEMEHCPDTLRLMQLHVQRMLGSDGTRTFFDTLRIVRGDKDWNLMFDYKNGRQVREDREMREKLNAIIRKSKKGYNGRKFALKRD
jgi:hypothetical protein